MVVIAWTRPLRRILNHLIHLSVLSAHIGHSDSIPAFPNKEPEEPEGG